MYDEDDQPTPPPPEIATRLRRELTAEMLGRVTKYARRRVKLKRRAGIPCFDTDAEAEDLATEAASLTVLGQRVWDPDVSLFQHLCGVVRSVSSDEIRKHHLAPRQLLRRPSMEESSDGQAKRDAQLVHHGTHRAAQPKRMVSMTDAGERLVSSLRVLAHNDRHVRLLLDAYVDGCDDAEEARDHAGLTAEEARNARRRLDRMMEELPKKFEEGAQDALEVSYGY